MILNFAKRRCSSRFEVDDLVGVLPPPLPVPPTTTTDSARSIATTPGTSIRRSHRGSCVACPFFTVHSLSVASDDVRTLWKTLDTPSTTQQLPSQRCWLLYKLLTDLLTSSPTRNPQTQPCSLRPRNFLVPSRLEQGLRPKSSSSLPNLNTNDRSARTSATTNLA